MKKGLRALLALCLSSSLLLAACAGGGPAADASQGGAPASGTGTGGEEPQGEKTKVVYQTWNPDTTRFPAVEAKFEEKYPEIDVQFVNVPYSDHIQKLKVDLSSGEGPDIFGLQAGAAMTEFSDFLVQIDPYAEQEWGEGWTGQLNPFAKDLLETGGAYYGIPLGVSYAGLVWVDRAWLGKYGLAVPASLEDLRACAKVLRENGDYPVAIGAKDDWINIDTWMNIMNDLSTEKLYAAIEGQTPFTDADLVQSFAIWQSLFTEGVVQDGALGVNMYNDTCDLFNKEGSIPILINGSWEMDAYLSEEETVQQVWNGGEHDMVPTIIDWDNDGTPAKLQSSVDSILCLNTNSQNKEAAWKLLAFMLFEGQDVLVNDYLMYFPSRANVSFAGELNEKGKENYDKIAAWGQENVGGYRENPYPELKQSIADNLKALALGEATPEAAAEAIEKVSKATAR